MASARPVLLVLSRQNLPLIRDAAGANRVLEGAYRLREGADLTLIATGSEVELALTAADTLATEGIHAAVITAPSFDLFAARPEVERERLLGSAPRIGIEAAIRQGWDLFLRPSDGFIGMTGFGASAPAPDLYRHFGITPEATVAMARKLMRTQ